MPDPRVDAVYTSRISGDVGRLNVPALVEIFADEAAARAAAEVEGAENESTPAASASGKKAIPEAYADYPKLYHDAIEKFKAKGIEGTPKKIREAIESDLNFHDCDPAIVMAWL